MPKLKSPMVVVASVMVLLLLLSPLQASAQKSEIFGECDRKRLVDKKLGENCADVLNQKAGPKLQGSTRVYYFGGDFDWTMKVPRIEPLSFMWVRRPVDKLQDGSATCPTFTNFAISIAGKGHKCERSLTEDVYKNSREIDDSAHEELIPLKAVGFEGREMTIDACDVFEKIEGKDEYKVNFKLHNEESFCGNVILFLESTGYKLDTGGQPDIPIEKEPLVPVVQLVVAGVVVLLIVAAGVTLELFLRSEAFERGNF